MSKEPSIIFRTIRIVPVSIYEEQKPARLDDIVSKYFPDHIQIRLHKSKCLYDPGQDAAVFFIPGLGSKKFNLMSLSWYWYFNDEIYRRITCSDLGRKRAGYGLKKVRDKMKVVYAERCESAGPVIEELLKKINLDQNMANI
ncbi:MAG: hypothetical protein ACOC3C_04775 [Candidatus Thorarchaeota archaeon]